MRLLVSAGGTGGGVYPALAVVRALDESAEVLWVGGEGGMEASLVQRAGIAFEAVPAAGVHGVGPRALPGNAWRLMRGMLAARRVLARWRPQVLFFTGGYVGVPVALAGRRLPKAVYVPDIEPGLALRVLARLADVICVTSERSRSLYPKGRRVVVTGYPTRPELRPQDRTQACHTLGLDPRRRVLLVFGGSRGARSINRALWQSLGRVLEVAQVVHITGELDWPEVASARQKLPQAVAADYHPHPYLHETMGAALAAADLAVCRAGASTLGELPLFGLPAVLVPYPHAWRYQRVNAAYLAENGAAVVVEDAELAERLPETVLSLLADDERLKAMGAAARRLARPGAAQVIAAEIVRLVEERPSA